MVDTELIILLGAGVLTLTIVSFFIYRTVTFLFLRKVITYILEPISDNKYHVIAKIKKPIGTGRIKYDEAIYPLDTKFSITDDNNSELLFFKHNNAKPLTFFEGEKGNAKLLKTFTKTSIWQAIFGNGGDANTTLILIVLIGLTLAITAYLAYSNNQMSGQIGLLQKQLQAYYNATKTGGIVIGK